jgi:hypothetical protein
MLPTGTRATPKVLYTVSYMGNMLGHWQKETCCAAKETFYAAVSHLCSGFPQFICTRAVTIFYYLVITFENKSFHSKYVPGHLRYSVV